MRLAIVLAILLIAAAAVDAKFGERSHGNKHHKKDKYQKFVQRVQEYNKASLKCTMCTFVTNFIADYIQRNETLSKIEESLLKVCPYFGDLEPLCREFVQSETRAIVQLLLDKVNPQTVCTKLGFCTNKLNALKEHKHFPKVERMSQAVKPKDGTLCSICELVIYSIESWLASNTTERQIVENLEGLCRTLPSGLSGMCLSFVDEYVPLAIKWLINKYPPEVFCTQIGLCSSVYNVERPIKTFPLDEKPIKTFPVNDKPIKTLPVEDKNRPIKIFPVDEKPVKTFPVDEKPVKTFPVNDKPVKTLPVEDKDKPIKTLPVPKLQTKKAGELCGLCQLVVATVHQYLQQNSTQQEIINYLMNVCNALPNEYKGMCAAFVKEYVPLAIQWIINNQPPQVFCTEIGLCSSQQRFTETRRPMAKLTRPHN